jgi:uncharacterized protein YceH (UPF0502 family)
MCVLMLSGQQSVGEIRTRGFSIYEFSGLEEVEETLRGLMARDPEAFVMKLPRQAGQKEARFAQLLAGEPNIEAGEAPGTERVTRRTSDGDRVAKLAEQVQTLTAQVENLSAQFAEFKKQFE